MEVTVVYYTASSEDIAFEARIRGHLLSRIGDLPLISVSQKPLPGFGNNICVGEHDNCYGNLFRQVYIALQEVQTPWVLTAEADFLYPLEYFTFVPPRKAPYYRYKPVYVHYNLNGKSDPKFFLKGTSNGAQMINRDYWLTTMEWTLNGEKEWFSKDDPVPPAPRVQTDKRYLWGSNIPAITFKTGNGVRRLTDVRNKNIATYHLPYWGRADDLRKEMFG